MDTRHRLEYLFKKYLDRESSPEEIEEFISLLDRDEAEETLSSTLSELWDLTSKKGKPYPVDWEQMYQRVAQQHHTLKKPRKRQPIYRIAAVLAGMLVLGAAGYLSLKRWDPVTPSQSTAVSMATEILPGSNRAILTLDNGETLILDPEGTSKLDRLERIKEIRLDSGYIVYQPGAVRRASTAPRYNTLRTPRGGQYRLQLPDGTKVWLNAESSIRYPLSFAGKERKVEITGEVYLEVAHNAAQPFVVDIHSASRKKGTIEVLGTRFNINAYDDESLITTTLIDGKVKFSSSRKGLDPLILKPGEQVHLAPDGNMRVVGDADLHQVLSWKEGLFVFRHDRLQDIMRRLSRWYDVEIVFEKNRAVNTHFTGTMARQETITGILDMLELTGAVKFKIEGRKIIATNPKPK